MKNPNGHGSVYKLSGNRRKPWVVRVTTGFTQESGVDKQQRKIIGCFADRKEAVKALAQYHDGLIDPLSSGMTFKELYDKWSAVHFKTISHHTIESYTTGFNGWAVFHDEPFGSIKHNHFQRVLDDTDKSLSSKSKMRTTVRMLAKYALVNDIIIKDYTVGLKITSAKEAKEKKPFTEAEIKKLWKNLYTIENVDLVLINIYTGMRPSEMLDVLAEDVNLEERWIRGGAKTTAGRGRLIPIHKAIHPLIMARLDSSSDRMIGVKYNYHNYLHRFRKVMDELSMDHSPSECRTTFATRIARTDADKLTVRRIMGHKDKHITDRVYTKKDISDLIQAIDMQPM